MEVSFADLRILLQAMIKLHIEPSRIDFGKGSSDLGCKKNGLYFKNNFNPFENLLTLR